MRSRAQALPAALALLVLLTTWGCGGSSPVDALTTASADSCHAISGPFHQRGAEILNGQNQRYVPYGIGIVGLAHDLYPGTVARDEEQMAASQQTWCANTVRLQVSQGRLIDGNGFDQATLQVDAAFFDAVKQEVQYARGLGLMVVVNLQAQTDPDFGQTLEEPTARAIFFWRKLAQAFGDDQGVVFDLFNEPGQVTWAQWRDGFTAGGIRYPGFQRLAEVVRAAGGKNILWVEGPQRAGTLRAAWNYHLRGVGPLMYAEHRPHQPNTVATWRTLFGYLAEKNLAPVVVGEWAQYARSDAPWACWNDAPTTVPRWLSYLASIDVGIVANKLAPGQLIQSTDYADPTVFKSDWRCENGLNQGAGLRILNWFHAQDVPIFGHTSTFLRLARAKAPDRRWVVTARLTRDGKRWTGKTVALQMRSGGHWKVVKTVQSRRYGRVRITYEPPSDVDRPMRLRSAPQGMYVGATSPVFRLPPR